MFQRIISSTYWKVIRRIVLWKNRCLFDEILVLGDSHSNVFFHKKFKLHFPTYFFNIVSVGGATVSGLKNPNSITQSLPIFKRNIKESKAVTAILLLGEVDTGFVIWYKADKYNIPIEDALDNAIKNYQSLILEASKKFRIICISTPLPTIEDNNDWGDVANERKNVNATQHQRTNLTFRFNKQIQGFCEKNGFIYLSFDDESIGENGMVHPNLLNSDSNDHHYDHEIYSDMIIRELKKHLVDLKAGIE